MSFVAFKMKENTKMCFSFDPVNFLSWLLPRGVSYQPVARLHLPHEVVLRPSRVDMMLSRSDHLGNAKLPAESPLEPEPFLCRVEVTGQARRVVALKLSNVFPSSIFQLQC